LLNIHWLENDRRGSDPGTISRAAKTNRPWFNPTRDQCCDFNNIFAEKN
jgi:hypothetical protein